jgi:hypothetical protein
MDSYSIVYFISGTLQSKSYLTKESMNAFIKDNCIKNKRIRPENIKIFHGDFMDVSHIYKPKR